MKTDSDECSVGMGWDVAGMYVQLFFISFSHPLIWFSQGTAAYCMRHGGFLNLGLTPEKMVHCLRLRQSWMHRSLGVNDFHLEETMSQGHLGEEVNAM